MNNRLWLTGIDLAGKNRVNWYLKQNEEGVLSFSKHIAGGVQLRTNGYGTFLELGRSRSARFTNLYVFEITEINFWIFFAFEMAFSSLSSVTVTCPILR